MPILTNKNPASNVQWGDLNFGSLSCCQKIITDNNSPLNGATQLLTIVNSLGEISQVLHRIQEVG